MINNKQKLICSCNLASYILSKIDSLDDDSVLNKNSFLLSDTFALLMNFKTNMWAEGPEYIYYEYKKEMGVIK